MSQKGNDTKIAKWLGWEWNAPQNKRQQWNPYWSDATGMSVEPYRTFFSESDYSSVLLLQVLVEKGFNPMLHHHTNGWYAQIWGADDLPPEDRLKAEAMGKTISAAISAAVVLLIESI
jgi:hypothetical protein